MVLLSTRTDKIVYTLHSHKLQRFFLFSGNVHKMGTSAVLHFLLADIAVRGLYRYAIVMNPIAKYNKTITPIMKTLMDI